MKLSQSRLNFSAEEAVRKAIADSSDDEILLDCFAQWGSNINGKNAGYGIEENYPAIRENLSGRFNISDAIASEFVSRIREYGTQFFLSGADIDFVRAKILEELMTDSGKKWRHGIQRRLQKSSQDSKRLTYVILYLLSRGFEAKTLENSIDEIQAFYSAIFGARFHADNMEEQLLEIGILNRVIYSPEDSMTKQLVHTINSMFTPDMIGLRGEDLKIQTDSRQIVSRMFEKKMFDQLNLLDNVSQERWGIKRFENGFGSLVPDKHVFGQQENFLAVSPFILEGIRDDLHYLKEGRLNEYESLIENSIFKTVNQSWPHCKVDFRKLKRERGLWVLDNGADPNLYVYLTLWASESELDALKSRFKVPNAACLIAIFLNQSVETARSGLIQQLGNCNELTMICAPNEKDLVAETLVGIPSSLSTDIIESLKIALGAKPKKNAQQAPKGVDPDAQVVQESKGPKIFIGTQETRDVAWEPARERNFNIGIFGDPKTGKTQAVKKILLELRKAGTPFLVIDSSGEYLPGESTNLEFGEVVEPSEIRVNPLELESGSSPRDREYKTIEVIDAVCELKDWEISYIQRAIKKAYKNKGIGEDNPNTWSNPPPTLQDVGQILETMAQQGRGYERDSCKEILQKIGSALTEQLFSAANTSIPFEKLVTGPVIIDLSGLKGDLIKSLATEFLMTRVPYFTESQSGDLRLFVSIDGSRIFGRNSASLRLLREARQRGIGIIYTNINPATLPESAFNNSATILSLRQGDSKNAKPLAEHMGIGEQELNKKLADKFTAVVKFSSQYGTVNFTIIPYSQKQEIKV